MNPKIKFSTKVNLGIVFFREFLSDCLFFAEFNEKDDIFKINAETKKQENDLAKQISDQLLSSIQYLCTQMEKMELRKVSLIYFVVFLQIKT
jgi:hypothetical protein